LLIDFNNPNIKKMINRKLEELVQYPKRLASSDMSVLILCNERKYSLDEEQATFLSGALSSVIEKLSIVFLEDENCGTSVEENQDILSRSFTYIFDKSLEMVYNIRVENEKETHFNFKDLINCWGGNQIPEYIQLKVTPIIPILAKIFNKTINYFKVNLEDILMNDITLKEQMKAIMYGGMQLGIEFCLQIDLENDSEMNRYLYG